MVFESGASDDLGVTVNERVDGNAARVPRDSPGDQLLSVRWTNVALRGDRRPLPWAAPGGPIRDARLQGRAEETRMDRLQRLKDLVDRLERLPESPDRERVLAEVRSRVVDVDTGVTPRAMLPLREPVPPPAAPRPRPNRLRPVAVARTPPPAPPRPAPAPASDHGVLLWDDRLSL